MLPIHPPLAVIHSRDLLTPSAHVVTYSRVPSSQGPPLLKVFTQSSTQVLKHKRSAKELGVLDKLSKMAVSLMGRGCMDTLFVVNGKTFQRGYSKVLKGTHRHPACILQSTQLCYFAIFKPVFVSRLIEYYLWLFSIHLWLFVLRPLNLENYFCLHDFFS